MFIRDFLCSAASDPMATIVSPALDTLLTTDGAMVAGGAAMALYGTVASAPFFSSGEKGWMSGFEAWRKGFYGDPSKGIVLGRYKGNLIVYTGRNHILVDGTTGTGKTAGPFLATLLTNKTHSFIVFDQSGELWRLTSGFRSTLGPTYQVNPGLATTDHYNPINDLPDSGRIISYLTSMFEPLFAGSASDQKKSGGDPHWERSPKAILPFIALQVFYGDDPTKKNIAGVLEYCSDDKACFTDMANNPRHPRCEQIGKQMMADGADHRSSIMAMIYTALSLWVDDSIVKMTNESSFRIEDVATNKSGPVTIYLTAPATDLNRMMPLYVMIEEMLKIHLMNDTKRTLSGKEKVRGVVILDDEAQNTKRPKIDILEVARKFWVLYFLGCQSLNAMVDLYGEAKLGLFKTKLSFRPTVGDKVVDRIVAMSGTYKKKVISESENKIPGKPRSHGMSWKIEEKPRLTKGDLENNWPEFGNALLTHPGRPAVLSMFDSEQDPYFSKFIMPEYRMDKIITLRPEWANISRPIQKVTSPTPKAKDSNKDTEKQKSLDDILAIIDATSDDEAPDDEEEEIIELPEPKPSKKRVVL